MANATTRIVDAYYESWASGDFERLRTLLAEDFAFRGPIDSADGPDAFIGLIQRNAPMFGVVALRNVRRVVYGARAVNLYDFAVGPIALPTAEAFEVREDRIERIDLYFDPSPLLATRTG